MFQVIKIGSACLFDKNGNVNAKLLQKRVWDIEESTNGTVLVVSGAIALGKRRERETRPNEKLTGVELQGYACMGQIELMNLYSKLFTKQVSQLLLTTNDLKQENHVRDLIQHNVRQNRITIINYNDGIDFEQIRKDNDTLAATILTYCGADRLIILGHYDGFYDQNGKVIKKIIEIEQKDYDLCAGKSQHGNGGFTTKLDAAKMILAAGKEMIIGNIEHSLPEVVKGNVKRTLFSPLK